PLPPPRCRRNARSAGGAPSRWRRTSSGPHLPFARPFHPSRTRKRGWAAPRLSRRGRSGTRWPHRRDARSPRARSAADLARDLAGEAHGWRRRYGRGHGRLRSRARRAQLDRLPGSNLCAIGDPDQAIYGFRGADASGFERFSQDHPAARLVRLARNYRSSGSIVTASAQVIASSPSGPIAEVVRDMHERVAVHTAATERAEAESVVAAI